MECGAPLRHRASVGRFRADADPRRGTPRAAQMPCLSLAASTHVWRHCLWCGGRVTFLNPFDLATLGVHRLGELVASFAEDDEAKRRIQDALVVATL